MDVDLFMQNCMSAKELSRNKRNVVIINQQQVNLTAYAILAQRARRRNIGGQEPDHLPDGPLRQGTRPLLGLDITRRAAG